MTRTHLPSATTGVVGGLDKNVITALQSKLDDFDATLDAQLADAVVAVAGTTVYTAGIMYVIPLSVPDSAGTTKNDFVISEKVEIIGVTAIKDTAGAGNTVQVFTSGDVAISDAIAFAVDKTRTSAATLDKATRTIAAGGTIRVTTVKAAGSTAGQIHLTVIKRP